MLVGKTRYVRIGVANIVGLVCYGCMYMISGLYAKQTTTQLFVTCSTKLIDCLTLPLKIQSFSIQVH